MSKETKGPSLELSDIACGFFREWTEPRVDRLPGLLRRGAFSYWVCWSRGLHHARCFESPSSRGLGWEELDSSHYVYLQGKHLFQSTSSPHECRLALKMTGVLRPPSPLESTVIGQSWRVQTPILTADRLDTRSSSRLPNKRWTTLRYRSRS